MTETGLSTIVTADMLGGVLDEVVSLLPVCIPVMISFIALRSGTNSERSAQWVCERLPPRPRSEAEILSGS